MLRNKNIGNILTGTIYIFPAMLFMSFSFLIPAVWNIILSFQSWDGFAQKKWVYADNYLDALRDKLLLKSFSNSFFLALFTTAVAVVLGVALAGLIYKLGRREGAVYRLILFLPAMIPMAIIGLLFSFVYNPEMGLVNQFLRLIGLEGLTNAWLENKNTVLLCIAVVGIWRILGLTMMLTFASLQSIPVTLLEASRLDGAGYGRQFFLILLPLVKPIIRLSVIFTLVISFRTYDLVYVMTGGGPANISKTVPLYMVDSAFKYGEFGYSSAMGFIMTIGVMLTIVVINRIMRGEQYEF